ncbi:MAG: hypothetical protein JW861_06300 [Bacteroidales bacterium]|nr:hypothetical protein [Bacteroidales bacterium]
MPEPAHPASEGSGRIYILSGAIRSGKTTRLMGWSSLGGDVAGILTPDRDGIRMMYDIAARKWFPFEAGPEVPEDRVIRVGGFRFSLRAFEKAAGILISALSVKPAWLVVDEVGRLELEGKGFGLVLPAVISRYKSGSLQGSLLLVVRDSLLDDVVRKFKLEGYTSFNLPPRNP